MRKFLYALLGCLIFAPLNAQKNPAVPKQPPNTWAHFESAQQMSAAQLVQDKSALRLGADDDLQLLSTKNDELGYRHYRYQQTYKNIPIEGAIYLMHEKNNRTKKANGKLISNINIPTVPYVSEAAALQSALQYVGADVYAWEDATHQALIQQVEQCKEATFYPSGDLVIIDPEFGQNPENYKLAYRFDVYAIAPLSRQAVYVDAQNSAVLTSIERLHSCTDVSASGNSNYSGTVNFTACQENGTHTLKSHINGVAQQVFNANNTLTIPEASPDPDMLFTDPDSFFEADPTAVDVHFATQKTYEYFWDTHSRNSMDGEGTPLYSWVHYGNNHNNAAWTEEWMIFGDGDNDKYSAWTSPDVVAHEMTHGITKYTSGLIYLEESGALNESFSDIFGEVVEAYIRGNSDWIVGAEFTIQADKNGIRNMSNPSDPNMFTTQPDTYLGNDWYTGAGDYGGVHYNSGVQNHWFYLLSEGGSGINDNGDSYNVTGIGMSKAAAIAYRNLTTYLISTAQYADARIGAIQSAIDLYGEGSEEALQTELAWSAVGVENVINPSCSVSDSLALVALYNSTDGANWTNTWDLAQPMDTWYGVALSENGCVTCIDMDGNPGCHNSNTGSSGNNLVGNIPIELNNLSDLKILSLGRNSLTGDIPSELGSISSLEYLYLESNLLSGSIPQELGNLSNLTKLDLSFNDLTGNIPIELGNLNSLTYLRLSSNELVGTIPRELGNLSNLTSLTLEANNLVGNIPYELGNLNNLERLWLYFNELTGDIPPELGNLHNLTQLVISNNQLSGTIPLELINLTNLTRLMLSSNQLVGTIPTGFGNLINLDDLGLSDNQLSGSIPPELGNLSELSFLRLGDNQLIGSIPPELGNLNDLWYFEVRNNQLSGCYGDNLMNLCNHLYSIYNVNSYISIGNNFDTSWEDFCATGAGSCGPDSDSNPVWPGDFNNDGIANNVDAILWGLAAGNTGLLRPNATTDWVAQTAPQWSESVIGINGKHQDADGDGMVDVDDLEVLVENYGLTHANAAPIGGSSPLQFELRPLGVETQGGFPALRYGIYSSSDAPINAHGLAFSLDLSELSVIETPQIETIGSALVPTNTINVYDATSSHTKIHVALTRTDQNNQLIIDGSLITECIIVVKDIPTNGPFEIYLEGGNTGSADGTISPVNSASVYSAFSSSSGGGVSFTSSVNVTHEQCYTLGSASIEVLGGTPPFTYLWSTGANTAEVTHLAAGTYTVEVSDSNGQDQIFSIQVDAPTAIYDEAGNEIDCSPHSAWLIPQLDVILEGPYGADTGMMTNWLQQLDLLPNIHPYNTIPWNYRGTEGQDLTVADFPDGTVDWVLVSLRDVQNVDRVYAKTAALLQQDGSLFFPNSRFLSAEIADSLHVVIQHRNHIAAMTPQPLVIDNNTITHDFSGSDSHHTSTSIGQKELPDGTWVMFAGDCEQSGAGYDINGNDKGLWLDSNGHHGDYFMTDQNLDGDVSGADKGLWFDNNGVSSVAPK